MVNVSHRLAIVGMAMLGVALVGVVLLIFDVVQGWTAGLLAGACAAVLLIALWLAMPLALRRTADSGESQ